MIGKCLGSAGAAALVLFASGTAFAAGEQQAGVSAGVRGQVARANAANPVGVRLASGEAIYLADKIESGPDSGMQVMLLDQTTFTIGPNSSVTIDKFVYDPATGSGQVAATLGKGVFRFVSGKIAAANPSNMTVKLPTATIGIRGTMVVGRTDETSTVVGLAGPGPTNNTGDKVAGVDVITPNGTGELRRPGWGVIIEPGKPPVVEQLPKLLLQNILNSVAPRAAAVANAATAAGAAQQVASGTTAPVVNIQTAAQGAGQNTAVALVDIGTVQAYGQAADSAHDGNGPGSPNNPSNSAPSCFTCVSSVILDGSTSFEDLRAVTTGVGRYADGGVALVNNNSSATVGSYNVAATIDFGTRQIAATFSNITVNDGVNGFSMSGGTVNLSLSFATGTGQVTLSGGTDNCGGSAGTVCGAAVLFANQGGVVAHDAFHGVGVVPSSVPAAAAHGGGHMLIGSGG